MKTLAIDRSGSMNHHSSVMLELLECILASVPVEIRVFDTSRRNDAYTCSVKYSHAANVINYSATASQNDKTNDKLHADNTIMSVVVDDRNGDKLIFDFGHPIKDIVDFALSKMGSVNIGGCPYKGDDWIAMELSEGRSCDYHSLEILVKCKIPDDRMVEEKKPVGEMQEPETEKYLFDGKPLSEYAKTN